MKKIIPMFLLVTLSVQAETIDMNDPTQTFSSVGTEMHSDGSVDFSFGVAHGKHMGVLESKGGLESAKLTYLQLEQGEGFYTELTGGGEVNSASAGYIWTLAMNDSLNFHPVAMAGYADANEYSHSTMTGTLGLYIRKNFDDGWSFGVDPFITGYDSMNDGVKFDYSADYFVGKQINNHRFRLGYTNVEDDGALYINYKIAF